MKRVLVTGAAGFIGSTLVDTLLAETDAQIVGLDAFTDYYPAALKRDNLSDALASDRATLVEGSIAELDLGSLLQGVDVVFHQAGQPGVRPSWGDSFTAYTRDNVDATQRLLEAVRQQDTVERVVYASSSSVYGNAERYPTLETDRPMPLSPYGVTKLAAEHLMSLYAANFGVPTVSLRYFTVYGPRQRPDMGFTRFIARGLLGRRLVIYGDGTQIRDFTFVDDIVRANIAAATAAELPAGEVLNVSGGSSVSLNECLAVIEELVGRPLDLHRSATVAGDVFRTGGDSSLAQKSLGWRPTVDLATGLGAQVAWLRPRVDSYAGIV